MGGLRPLLWDAVQREAPKARNGAPLIRDRSHIRIVRTVPGLRRITIARRRRVVNALVVVLRRARDTCCESDGYCFAFSYG